MGIAELLVLAVGLSMDAFAVAICKGLALQKIKPRHMIVVGAWFGGFQALMPLIGFFLASMFAQSIQDFDHWVAFALLALIGGNMIREAIRGDEEEADASLAVITMLVMAVATSIDALAVGISLAVVSANIWASVCLIGVVTFALSALGVKLGSVFGAKYKSKAELAGGVILVLLGLKILLEHLGVL